MIMIMKNKLESFPLKLIMFDAFNKQQSMFYVRRIRFCTMQSKLNICENLAYLKFLKQGKKSEISETREKNKLRLL